MLPGPTCICTHVHAYLYMLLPEFLQTSEAGMINQVPLLPVPRPFSIMVGPQHAAGNTLECGALHEVNSANTQGLFFKRKPCLS